MGKAIRKYTDWMHLALQEEKKNGLNLEHWIDHTVKENLPYSQKPESVSWIIPNGKPVLAMAIGMGSCAFAMMFLSLYIPYKLVVFIFCAKPA